jgi:Na+/phosphate symporter
MENTEREEVKDIVHEVTVGPLSRIEASINVIEFRLTSMDDHMKIANGNTAKNVLKIAHVENNLNRLKQEIKRYEIKCPQSDTIDSLKEIVVALNLDKIGRDKLDALVDNTETRAAKARAEKRAKFLKIIETAGVIIAALALLVNLYFSAKLHRTEAQSAIPNTEVNTTS